MALYQTRWHLHLFVEFPGAPNPNKQVESTLVAIKNKFAGYSPALHYHSYQHPQLHQVPSFVIEVPGERLGDVLTFLMTNDDVVCPWAVHIIGQNVWEEMDSTVWSDCAVDILGGTTGWLVTTPQDVKRCWTVILPTGVLNIKYEIPGV